MGPVSGMEKWPVTGLPALSVTAISSCTAGSPAITPGKFIISPRPAMFSQLSASAISTGPRQAPASSRPGAAGTHDGTVA